MQIREFFLNICENHIGAVVLKEIVMVQTSGFGAEFVTMKQGTKALRGLRCKLRMMGVPISSPSYIYEDNMSFVCDTSKPESVLRRELTQFAIT